MKQDLSIQILECLQNKEVIYMDIVLKFQVLDLESEDSDEEVNMEINTLLKTYMQALQQEISITDMVNTSFTQKAPLLPQSPSPCTDT